MPRTPLEAFAFGTCVENRSPFILDPHLQVESLTGQRHDRVQSNSQELQPCSRYAL